VSEGRKDPFPHAEFAKKGEALFIQRPSLPIHSLSERTQGLPPEHNSLATTMTNAPIDLVRTRVCFLCPPPGCALGLATYHRAHKIAEPEDDQCPGFLYRRICLLSEREALPEETVGV
jgi:hypothetical protein